MVTWMKNEWIDAWLAEWYSRNVWRYR